MRPSSRSLKRGLISLPTYYLLLSSFSAPLVKKYSHASPLSGPLPEDFAPLCFHCLSMVSLFRNIPSIRVRVNS